MAPKEGIGEALEVGHGLLTGEGRANTLEGGGHEYGKAWNDAELYAL